MEHLSNLAGIDFGTAEVLRNADLDTGLRAGAGQVDGIHHELGNGNQAADRRAAFRKRQQLRGQKHGPLAGVCGIVQDILDRLLRFELHLEQLQIALHHGEEIVEVVRDAARQHAKRFELARTQQLIFDLFALRDLGAQLLGRSLQFGGAFADPDLQFLIQRLRMVLGGLQVQQEVLIFKLQHQR